MTNDFYLVGVSCFRQIETEKLINRIENDGSEFSRSSVQKAVRLTHQMMTRQ